MEAVFSSPSCPELKKWFRVIILRWDLLQPVSHCFSTFQAWLNCCQHSYPPQPPLIREFFLNSPWLSELLYTWEWSTSKTRWSVLYFTCERKCTSLGRLFCGHSKWKKKPTLLQTIPIPLLSLRMAIQISSPWCGHQRIVLLESAAWDPWYMYTYVNMAYCLLSFLYNRLMIISVQQTVRFSWEIHVKFIAENLVK